MQLGIRHSTSSACAVADFLLCVSGQLCALTACTIVHMQYTCMGMFDGRGYDGQQKYTISDACKLCHLIRRSTWMIVFRQICYAYKWLRCLHLEIWQFFVDNNDDNTTNYFTPCTCTRGNYFPPILPAIWYNVYSVHVL